MFSALVLEREPLRLEDVGPAIVAWIQTWGGWAAFGLALWLLLGYTRMQRVDKERIPAWLKGSIAALTVLSALAYVGLAVVRIVEAVQGETARSTLTSPGGLCLFLGGAAAILAVCLPILRNMVSWRPRRIWGLTRLSYKEAIRNRILYVFAALALVFLFASWFIPFKPEDQVRTYVSVLYLAVPGLLLLAFLIVAAFSIPTDIRKQTIHTVVTKPVERFEIFLGRFVGFSAMMTLVLVVMATVSLIYLLRGIDPAAADESLKAREPLYGELTFRDAEENQGAKGVSVGREWDYRSYISRGLPGQPQLFAVWRFPAIPSALRGRDKVRCEFTFDIYRTTKGHENRGIACRFAFETTKFPKSNPVERRAREEEYRRERDQMLAQGNKSRAQVAAELINKYGYYEVPSTEVVDFHTQSIDVPGALFSAQAQEGAPAPLPGREAPPPLEVRVAVLSASQYVGMAKFDLFFRQDDPEGSGAGNRLLFAANFYKGAVGLWMRLCLVIGVAVALSTYFSGVISLIVAGFLNLCGTNREFINSLASGTAPEGGPVVSMRRLVLREVSAIPIDETTTSGKFALESDVAFRWMMRRFMDLVPDVDRYDLTSYVAEGFNVSGTNLLLCLGMMVGYLLPWAVLAYYLLRWREVASTS
jgi:ABC-type transport system involved in multi-copper enzyme maturation permease subunit